MKKIYTLAFGICSFVLSNAQVSDIGSYVQVTDVSNSGIAVGNINGVAYFMWSKADSGKIIGESGENGVSGNANISADGTLISMSIPNENNANKDEAVLFNVTNDSYLFLGGLAASSGSDTSSSWGMSSNGKNIVGLGWTTASKAEGFVWNKETGIIGLGSTVSTRSSRAESVSADGLVVAGWQDSSNGIRQGAIWKNGVQQILKDKNGTILGPASGISADGKTVVGSNFSTSEAYIWNETEGVILLTHDNPDYKTNISAISDDGSVVIGLSFDPFGQGILMGEGFIWTKKDGKVNLNTFIDTLGFDDLNITLSVPTGISPNGKYIGGIGANLVDSDARGFLIELPDSVLSVEEMDKISAIQIHPNPVKDVASIKTTDKVESVEVYNLVGQLVFSSKTVVENKVNISTLPKGVYLLKVKTDKDLQTTKIIKN